MWLCTKLGFYSIVEKLPEEIHVRARCKVDLENLKNAVARRIGAKEARWKIHRTDPADYRWRIVVTPAALAGIMLTLAQELDYSNFKGVIAATPQQRPKMQAYVSFHHAMEGFQNRHGERSEMSLGFQDYREDRPQF